MPVAAYRLRASSGVAGAVQRAVVSPVSGSSAFSVAPGESDAAGGAAAGRAASPGASEGGFASRAFGRAPVGVASARLSSGGGKAERGRSWISGVSAIWGSAQRSIRPSPESGKTVAQAATPIITITSTAVRISPRKRGFPRRAPAGLRAPKMVSRSASSAGVRVAGPESASGVAIPVPCAPAVPASVADAGGFCGASETWGVFAGAFVAAVLSVAGPTAGASSRGARLANAAPLMARASASGSGPGVMRATPSSRGAGVIGGRPRPARTLAKDSAGPPVAA
jgi:hypothetical protein